MARPLPALGVILPEGTGAWWTLLVCTVGIGFYAQQARTVAASPDAQATLRKQIESQPNVRMILPATVREARVFTGVSITAGICEELLYRGYLLWYLQSLGLGRGALSWRLSRSALPTPSRAFVASSEPVSWAPSS